MFCNACGKLIPEGQGQRFVVNDKPDIYLCESCNNRYWLHHRDTYGIATITHILVGDERLQTFRAIDRR